MSIGNHLPSERPHAYVYIYVIYIVDVRKAVFRNVNVNYVAVTSHKT